jgi:hypothetical protein
MVWPVWLSRSVCDTQPHWYIPPKVWMWNLVLIQCLSLVPLRLCCIHTTRLKCEVLHLTDPFKYLDLSWPAWSRLWTSWLWVCQTVVIKVVLGLTRKQVAYMDAPRWNFPTPQSHNFLGHLMHVIWFGAWSCATRLSVKVVQLRI